MIEILTQLGIDWRLLLAQVVNFLILLYVLKRFAYKPVLDVLDARKERVENAKQVAQEAEHKMEIAEQERENILDEARKQSTEIIAQAEKDAQSRGEHILEEAEKERARITKEGEKVVQEERAKLRHELKSEVGGLVTDAIRKTVADLADERTTKRLTDEALEILNSEYSHTRS